MMNDEKVNSESEDPLIDEIRAIRSELSDRFGNDVVRLAHYLRSQQSASGHEIVQPNQKASIPTPD